MKCVDVSVLQTTSIPTSIWLQYDLTLKIVNAISSPPQHLSLRACVVWPSGPTFIESNSGLTDLSSPWNQFQIAGNIFLKSCSLGRFHHTASHHVEEVVLKVLAHFMISSAHSRRPQSNWLANFVTPSCAIHDLENNHNNLIVKSHNFETKIKDSPWSSSVRKL